MRTLKKHYSPRKKLPEIAKLPDTSELPDIKSIREAEVKMPDITDKKIVDDEIYSDDLLFASQINDLIPPIPLTDEEIKAKLIDKIFLKKKTEKKLSKSFLTKMKICLRIMPGRFSILKPGGRLRILWLNYLTA